MSEKFLYNQSWGYIYAEGSLGAHQASYTRYLGGFKYQDQPACWLCARPSQKKGFAPRKVVGMKIFLLKKERKNKKEGKSGFYFTLAGVDDNGKWTNIVGPNGNQVLGFDNMKSGNIQLLEGTPRQGSAGAPAMAFSQVLANIATVGQA